MIDRLTYSSRGQAPKGSSGWLESRVSAPTIMVTRVVERSEDSTGTDLAVREKSVARS